jgi:Homeodomain-like domain
MGTKIPTPAKQFALQKLRDGLSNKEVAELTGVSLRTVQTWRQQYTRAAGLPARSPAQTPPTPAMPTHAEEAHAEEESTTLDFEESPAPPEKKNPVDSAFSSFKAMFGVPEKGEEKKASAPLAAKLTTTQQQFVSAWTPTLALAIIGIAAWTWSHAGSEYIILAPDEDVAAQIVTPMLRIWARHAGALTNMSPDWADAGAATFALAGYVRTSWTLYQQIKWENSNNAQQRENDTNGARQYSRGGLAQSENGASHFRDRSSDVRGGGDGSNGTLNGGHNGATGGNVDLSHLADKEQRQYEALLRLSQLDYQHRARRSLRSA